MTEEQAPSGKKRCYICGKIKLKKSFHKDATRHDGVQSRCKECNRKKKWNFKCPNCAHEYQGNIDKAMPCPKCWRVSIPCSANY